MPKLVLSSVYLKVSNFNVAYSLNGLKAASFTPTFVQIWLKFYLRQIFANHFKALLKQTKTFLLAL